MNTSLYNMKPSKLGINSKVIDISDILELSLEDFMQRLVDNDVIISTERAACVYN